MRITLLAIGKKMPSWVDTGFSEYARRLRGSCTLELVELAQLRHNNSDQLRQRESELLLARIPAGNHVVALDNRGEEWDTSRTASELQSWKAMGQDICILIGGPEGLTDQVLQRASQSWSLSRLTFPHPLVRIIVAEQLYRAESILNNHPYHRP